MNDTTIAPDSRPIEPNPANDPPSGSFAAPPEHSNKITEAWPSMRSPAVD